MRRAASIQEKRDLKKKKKSGGLVGLAPPTRPFQFPRAQPVNLPNKVPVALVQRADGDASKKSVGRYNTGFGTDAPAPISPPLASPGAIDVDFGGAQDGDLWRTETPINST